MERRQRKRIPVSLNVLLQVGEQHLTFTESRDVSMSGIFLLTETPLPEGTEGELSIRLESGEEHLRIRSGFEVVRVIPPGEETPGMGLAFTGLDPDSSIHLFNLIRYQEQWNEPS